MSKEHKILLNDFSLYSEDCDDVLLAYLNRQSSLTYKILVEKDSEGRDLRYLHVIYGDYNRKHRIPNLHGIIETVCYTYHHTYHHTLLKLRKE